MALQVRTTVYSPVTETYGYIGIHNDSKTIIVAFQGCSLQCAHIRNDSSDSL